MDSVEIVVNKDGVRDMLGSDGVMAVLKGKADQVRDIALGMVSEDNLDNDAFYSAARVDDKGIARSSVYTGNPHGYNACLSDNVLLKALG